MFVESGHHFCRPVSGLPDTTGLDVSLRCLVEQSNALQLYNHLAVEMENLDRFTCTYSQTCAPMRLTPSSLCESHFLLVKAIQWHI